MFNAIIRLALRYRLAVVAVSLFVLIFGSYQTTQLPIDVMPDMDRPRVTIMTECPGLSAEEVETLVTFPLEAAVLGANGVQDVRSNSVAGLSVINVEFDWNADRTRARQTVQERLTAVQGDLPPDVRPYLTPTASIMGQIMVVGMYRREGPNGGELAQVGTTRYMAERTPDGDGWKLQLWDPRPRNDPRQWKPMVEKPERELPRKGDTSDRYSVTLAGARHEIAFLPFHERQMALRTTADWAIRPRLRKIPGIGSVTALGGGRKQYHVIVDPKAMHEYDVTLEEVEQAVRESNPTASGGMAIRGDSEVPIRILARPGPDPARTMEQLRQVPIKTTPKRSVLLHQVARVEERPQFKRGDGSIDGHPGVVFTITKQPHADTRTLTTEVETALRESEESLPADIVLETNLFKMKGFIDRSIFNVGEALAIGGILVLVVLFLFLLNFRTTFISLAAIPLSLALTTLVFRLIGWLSGTELSVNVMTLGGIAVAMGELVDDAVVDVENIFRRLRENKALPQPRPALEVVYHASAEVRSAIVFGTAVVILVFLPLFALSGVEGRLFTPLGIAYIVSILASLLVSLTVTPVLSYYLLARPLPRIVSQLISVLLWLLFAVVLFPLGGARIWIYYFQRTEADGMDGVHRTTDSPLVRGLKYLASYVIRFSMARPGWLLLGTWLLVGLAVWQLTRLGTDFLPPFDEGSVQVNMILPSGSSLESSNEVSAVADRKFKELQATPEHPDRPILHYVRWSGRAELDEHVDPVNSTEYILNINPNSKLSRTEMLNKIETELKEEVPHATIENEQPLAHLLSHMLSGVNAQIAIKIYGDDLPTLRRVAEQIKKAIQKVPGLTTPVIEAQEEIEEIHITPRTHDLAFYGMRREQVAHFLETALRGDVVTQIIEGQRRFDLLVRLDDRYRTDYGELERLKLRRPEQQGTVMVKDLVDIEPGLGPNTVTRENARRRLAIRCNARDRDLGSVVNDVQTRISEEVVLPEGYHVEYGGQFESQQRATWLISILAGISILGMFVVLYLLFPSTRIILQILNALPTAFIGGVIALTLTGQTLTVASMVGFISLGGIAVRNGILLVTHYFHLMKYEGAKFDEAMVVRGSLERLSPVLMTALTAGIALIPLVLGGQQPGREILYPVATVILGGLVTSTFCEFLIHPGLFWRFSGQDAVHLVRQGQGE